MINSIANHLAKWNATVRIQLTKHLAYKIDFLLLMVGPSLIFLFIKYNLWTTIYDMPSVDTLNGYDLRKMISYQIWVLIVALVSQSFSNENLAEDIRLGRVSAYLIYPFRFWQFHGASFIALQIIQCCVATVSLTVFIGINILTDFSVADLLKGGFITFLVSLLYFAMTFMIGIIALLVRRDVGLAGRVLPYRHVLLRSHYPFGVLSCGSCSIFKLDALSLHDLDTGKSFHGRLPRFLTAKLWHTNHLDMLLYQVALHCCGIVA